MNIQKILTLLSFSIVLSLQSPLFASETGWKEYMDAGAKLIRFDEFNAQMKKSKKQDDQKEFQRILYSVASRETIRKSGKYIRAALVSWQKDQAITPTKSELEKLELMISMVWDEELKYAVESTAGQPKNVKLPAIQAVQLRMKADNAIIIQMALKVLGKDDPGYKTLVRSQQKNDESLAKYK